MSHEKPYLEMAESYMLLQVLDRYIIALQMSNIVAATEIENGFKPDVRAN